MKNGVLYIIGVPIGNYSDITFRALNTLKLVDLVICEDTKETKKLLDNFLIRKDLVSYIGSNIYEKVFNLLKSGKDVALVSDRGMPCISDPGAEVIQYFRKINANIIIIPGVSAPITAFALIGLKGGFNFHGFLPKKKGDIINIINNLTNKNYIFFESPYRIKKTLTIFREYLPERIIYIARELTKTYEELLIGTSEELLTKEIQGEIVLIL